MKWHHFVTYLSNDPRILVDDKRYTGVNNLPKVAAEQCLTKSQTWDLSIASPQPSSWNMRHVQKTFADIKTKNSKD